METTLLSFMVQSSPLTRRLRMIGGAFFAPILTGTSRTHTGVAMAEKTQESEEQVEETPQVTNLEETSVEVVEAEMVRMHQSAAQEITADEVSLQQSAALDVTAADVKTHESALGLVNAKEVELNNSAAGVIRAENVNVIGQAGIVMAETVHLGNTYAGVVACDTVHAEQIETLFLFSSHVEGDVQTVVDTRGALIAGMVGGLLAGIVLLIGRLVFGRR